MLTTAMQSLEQAPKPAADLSCLVVVVATIAEMVPAAVAGSSYSRHQSYHSLADEHSNSEIRPAAVAVDFGPEAPVGPGAAIREDFVEVASTPFAVVEAVAVVEVSLTGIGFAAGLDLVVDSVSLHDCSSSTYSAAVAEGNVGNWTSKLAALGSCAAATVDMASADHSHRCLTRRWRPSIVDSVAATVVVVVAAAVVAAVVASRRAVVAAKSSHTRPVEPPHQLASANSSMTLLYLSINQMNRGWEESDLNLLVLIVLRSFLSRCQTNEISCIMGNNNLKASAWMSLRGSFPLLCLMASRCQMEVRVTFHFLV